MFSIQNSETISKSRKKCDLFRSLASNVKFSRLEMEDEENLIESSRLLQLTSDDSDDSSKVVPGKNSIPTQLRFVQFILRNAIIKKFLQPQNQTSKISFSREFGTSVLGSDSTFLIPNINNLS